MSRSPRLGRELALDLTGAPNESYAIFAAPRRGNTPTPFGTLWLSSELAGVSFGTLDGQGRAAYRMPVPSSAALRDAKLFWQAVVAGPITLGNLEVTTLRDL